MSGWRGAPPLEPQAKPRNSSTAGCAEIGPPSLRSQSVARRSSCAPIGGDGFSANRRIAEQRSAQADDSAWEAGLRNAFSLTRSLILRGGLEGAKMARL